MSTSEPSRKRVARPSVSNTTRWPWRSMRKMEPERALGGKVVLAAVGVAHQNAGTRHGVIRLHYAPAWGGTSTVGPS